MNFNILLAEINIYLLMMNDSFTALRQIILTSGTLLKEDLHKVCLCFCFEVFYVTSMECCFSKHSHPC